MGETKLLIFHKLFKNIENSKNENVFFFKLEVFVVIVFIVVNKVLVMVLNFLVTDLVVVENLYSVNYVNKKILSNLIRNIIIDVLKVIDNAILVKRYLNFDQKIDLMMIKPNTNI